MKLEAYLSGKCRTAQFHDERDSTCATHEVKDPEQRMFLGELFDPKEMEYGDKRPYCHVDHVMDMASDMEDAELIAFVKSASTFTDFIHLKESK